MSTIFNYLRFFLLLILFIDNLNAQPPFASYSNLNNSLNTTSFEACLGDTVTFSYTNLTHHPNALQLKNNIGTNLNIPLSVGGNLTQIPTGSNSNKSGTIRLVIPLNAATGNVKLIRNNGAAIHNFNNNLIIHNTSVNFHLPQAPFCATDTIPLIGVPTGGIFSSTLSNLIDTSNNTLIGMNADWTLTINDSIKDISITYAYTPEYISGISCPNSIQTSDTIRIRDNRLNRLKFKHIVTDYIYYSYNRVSLHIDSPIVESISPNLTSRNYPISFSGNYINRINGIDSFFIENAGYGSHPITMQYNNGGCVGELTANLDVLTPVQLSGIVDTLCNDADPITIKRDSSAVYAYHIIRDTLPASPWDQYYGVAQIIIIEEVNIIDSIYTQNPDHNQALTSVNPLSHEEYIFDPRSSVLDTVVSTTIVMKTSSKTTYIEIDSFGSIIYDYQYSFDYFIEYPITLVDRPTVDFTLDSTYCKNSEIASLAPTVPFSSFTYASSLTPSGSLVIFDSLSSHQFNPDSIYTQFFPLAPQSQDLQVQLVCTVNRYGCVDSDTQSTQINAIPTVSLNGLALSYCANDTLVQLNGLPLPNPINNIATYKGSGITDTIQGTFSPTIAGVGIKDITYSFEAENGCKNSISKTTTIRPIPILQFNFPQNQYCVSDSIVTLDQNSLFGTYTFWGNIIDSTNLLNPKDTTGQQTIFYALTDSWGCTDTSNINILINPLPIITISGLDSAYCFNSSIDNISVSPTPTLPEINGSSNGFNVNNLGIEFNPSHDSSGIKLFTYTYSDNVTTCSNTVRLNTTVYDVPTLSYTGIDSIYCAIDSSYSIAGIPVGGIFSGAGISDIGSQYYFNPIFTGGGERTLKYKIDTTILYGASDTLLCSIEKDINIVINALPTPSFNGPSDNYRFCSNDANVLLEGLGLGPTQHLFTSTTPDAINRSISIVVDSILLTVMADTSYTFSPSLANAGMHEITYHATNAKGCQDSIVYTYYVTNYDNGASFILDSAYCASSQSIPLYASPSGGNFYRNQNLLNPASLDLNTSITLLDTITYKVTYDACMDSATQFVTISPLTNLSFSVNKPSKTYCTGEKDPILIPNVPNGTFSGNAVINGDTSFFSLQYANIGKTLISYTYIDSATSCESIITDSIFVYHMPNFNFNVVGGCQSDTIFFQPNNDILNLDPRDNITSVSWQLDTATFIIGSSPSYNNKIDSTSYVFNTPGIYFTKLFVANQIHCVDTSIVRVVISPTITSNEFPYDQTFESSDGNWYAEAKDNTHDSLWQWGADANIANANITGANIWTTKLNGQYTANEAAWVYSPCFDISNLERPMIRFDRWSDSRDRGDGAVLEFQNPDGTWSPLGELDRGINWFNSGFIAGSPGDQSNQVLSPIGWSGQSKKWINSRYKLDEFKGSFNSKLRLRIAFGSSPADLVNFHNGFAFDNVWIGNRTRNVLLETTSNIHEQNMDVINTHVYQLAYHSNVNKDLILLQYHSKISNKDDEFHLFNPAVANSRTLFYGVFYAGKAFIDGTKDSSSILLNDLSFEQSMLESPKFKVEIDTFYYNNSGQFTLTTTVTALVNIPDVERYRIHMVITEDSLSYSTGEKVHAVVRKDYPSNNINTFDKSWVIREQITLSHTYSATNLNYVPNHFQAVAFIQAQKSSAREIFQAATTRDVNGYWVGIDQVASEEELNEIKDMTLYPNPARDYINIDFPELLKKDYSWKLISIGGITVKEDVINAGEQSLKINNYDLPSGVYIFMVYNGNVYSQRKVIINQD
jgi:hypothetical protein